MKQWLLILAFSVRCNSIETTFSIADKTTITFTIQNIYISIVKIQNFKFEINRATNQTRLAEFKLLIYNIRRSLIVRFIKKKTIE